MTAPSSLDRVRNKSASKTDENIRNKSVPNFVDSRKMRHELASDFGHSCDREFKTIQCLVCGASIHVLGGSKDRTCPACSMELYQYFDERYVSGLSKYHDLKHVVLTWKPVRKQDPKIVRSMGTALRKLLHQKWYSKHWHGLLAVIECKKTPYGWFYYHLHCIVSGEYRAQKDLSLDWRAVSGFPIVWIRRIWRTAEKAIRYVLKYIMKGFHFKKLKDVADFKASMRGVRYVRSYGEFYGKQYHSAEHVYFPCPECGAVKAWICMDGISPKILGEGEPYFAFYSRGDRVLA